MATITIDDEVAARLKLKAESNGRSMEDEAREILKAGLGPQVTIDNSLTFSQRLRRHFEPNGGADLDIPEREISPLRPIELD